MAAARITDDPYVLRLRQLFLQRYGHALEFACSPEGAAAITDKFFVRTLNYHLSMVPWIEGVFPLAGCNVLEIGCGSGAATFAVAPHCAHVDSFDISDDWLREAAAHAAFFGIGNVTFRRLDADWAYPDRIAEARTRMRPRYDAVLLPAVLEHMEMAERLTVLTNAWELLRTGGIMIIYDTPNRLHPFDIHSFRLPFFNWLPDDLALLYASRSPRTELSAALAEARMPMHTLYRLGRGLSYHEFELAIGLGEMQVVADGYSHLLTHRAINSGFEGMIAEALRQYAPHVPVCFSKEYLEFVARKKWDKATLIAQQDVRHEVLDQVRPALVLDGADARLEYDLGGPGAAQILAEVLRHPWSAELVCSDQDGEVFHRETLTAPYPITDLLRIMLPPSVRHVRLQVDAATGAVGRQAWIFGFGCVRE